MKTVISTVVISLFVFISCSKDNFAPSPVVNEGIGGDPNIATVDKIEKAVFSTGWIDHPEFTFYITVKNQLEIKNLKLYYINNQLVGIITNPKTGKYKLSDNGLDFLNPDSVRYYHFEFEMNNGKKIILNKFR